MPSWVGLLCQSRVTWNNTSTGMSNLAWKTLPKSPAACQRSWGRFSSAGKYGTLLFFPYQLLVNYIYAIYGFLPSFFETNQPNLLKQKQRKIKIARKSNWCVGFRIRTRTPATGGFPAPLPGTALAARRVCGGPTLATCRGCFCSLPPCSLKPQGAPPVMEMQIKSPVPIFSF